MGTVAQLVEHVKIPFQFIARESRPKRVIAYEARCRWFESSPFPQAEPPEQGYHLEIKPLP